MYAMRAPPATTAAEDGSDADVLVPELRVLGDETRHHPDARGILQDLDGDAARTQVRFLARERAVLAGDHVRDAVQQDRAAAHRARRQGRVEHRRAVDGRGLASGILERVHLAVQNRAPALDPAVVAATDDAAVVHEHGSNRNPALAQSLLGFFDRRADEIVSHETKLSEDALSS